MRTSKFYRVNPVYASEICKVIDDFNNYVDDIYGRTLEYVEPFEVTEDNIEMFNSGIHHFTQGIFIHKDKCIEISREEYIQEYVKILSCKELNSNVKDSSPSEFRDMIQQAFVNYVGSSKDDYHYGVYTEFRRTLASCAIKSDIHCLNTELDDNKREIQLWITCSKPGYIIGRCGEIIDAWKDILDSYVKLWRDNYSISIRIREYDPLRYYHSDIHI